MNIRHFCSKEVTNTNKDLRQKQWDLGNLIILSSLASLPIVFAEPVQAATFDVLKEDTVTNVFLECLNDGVAISTDPNSIDKHGWQYTKDSSFDGVDGFQVGGNAYEIYGLALKETEDSIFVTLNANMPLTGTEASGAIDGNIGWGDLFFNFSGNDFSTASNAQELFAVRFAGTNDSLAPQVGLYGNVSATSTTSINSGFSSITSYNQRVDLYGCTGIGCGPNFGDLPADTSYFDPTQSFNAIASGQYLAGISFLSNSELADAGYKLDKFAGQHTIAFKFDKSAICHAGHCKKEVPEPSNILGFAFLGLVLIGYQLQRFSR